MSSSSLTGSGKIELNGRSWRAPFRHNSLQLTGRESSYLADAMMALRSGRVKPFWHMSVKPNCARSSLGPLCGSPEVAVRSER